MRGISRIFIISILSLFAFAACGKTVDSPQATGSLSFSLSWQQPENASRAGVPHSSALTGDVCVDYGITIINATIYNSGNYPVAYGSWACSAHSGTITSVPVGTNMKLQIEGLVGGVVMWRGEKTGITVTTGQTSHAGSIVMAYSGDPWVMRTIVALGDVGKGASIAMDASGKLHVSYFNNTTSTLNYANNSSGSWDVQVIGGAGGRYYTSLALDSSGKAHIAYINSTGVRYATNSSGSWDNTRLVDSAGDLYAAIAVDSSGKAHVAYYDKNNNDLKYATNASGPWDSETVDSITGTVGYYVSIAVNSTNGKVHISYYDETNHDLKYATGSWNSWTTSTIDASTGYYFAGRGTSILVDSQDKAHVAYRAYNSTYPYCWVRYATNASGSWAVTNTTSYTDPGYWDTADTGARATSIAMDSDGMIHIAYHDYGDGSLKYVTNAFGQWAAYTVAISGTEVGKYASLKLSPADKAYIAHYDGGTRQNLRVSTNADFVNTAAAVPYSLSATPGPGDGQMTLIWNSIANATSYNIYYGTSSGVTKATGTKITNAVSPYIQNGLSIGTPYYYVLTSQNSYGESNECDQITASPGAVPSAPASPSALAGASGTGQITVSWTAASGATSYNIYYGTSPGITNTSSRIPATSPYTHTGRSAGTNYYYRIAGVNQYGEGPLSAEVSALTSAPTGVSFTSIGGGQVDLSWNGVTGASSYNIYWSTSPGVTKATGTKISGTTGGSYAHTSLTKGTFYYYVVTAVNDFAESAESSEISASPWTIQVVSNEWDAGTDGNDIAVDSSGNAHVGYHVLVSCSSYQEYNKCGMNYATNSSGSWQSYNVTQIQDQQDGRNGVSIALDSAEKIHLGYASSVWVSPNSTYYLKYATNASGSWITNTVETILNKMFLSPSIAMDSGGKAHIGYNQHSGVQGSSDYDVKEATNASGTWISNTADSGVYQANMAFALDSSGKSHMAYETYTTGSPPTLHMKYATNASGSWVETNVEDISSSGYYYLSPSIAIDSGGKAHITYTDYDNRVLKYATNASGSWVVSTIVSTWSSYSPSESDLALDAAGKVHVSFFEYPYVKYATNASGSWRVAAVAVGGSGGSGGNGGLAIDSSVKAHISFHDGAGRNLKYCTNK